MLTLLTKDIRALFSGKKGDGHILRAVLTLICALLFSLLEYGLMYALFSKAQSLISAPVTLATMVLTFISVIMTVVAFLRASKLFFNKQDSQQIAIRPVSSAIVTASRLLALAVMHCLTAMLIEYPVFLAYISVYNKSVWFYYMAFAYPLIAGLCEMGIALALLYPIRLLLQYIKKNRWVKIAAALGFAALVVCPCAIVIHKSTAILSEQGFVALLTGPLTAWLARLNNLVLPINLLIDYMFMRTNGLYPYLAISLGIFWLGTSFDAFFLHKIGRSSNTQDLQRSPVSYSETPLWKYLLKQELKLRAIDPRSSLVFPILLILQPYALYLIARTVSAWTAPDAIIPMQSVFAGTAPILITLITVLSTLMIYSLSDNKNQMGAIKTYDHVHPSHNAVLISKMLMPLTLSATFMTVSVLVLLLCGMLSPLFATFTFLISITALATVATVSWHNIPKPRFEQPKPYYAPTVFAISLVILFMILGTLLTLIRCPVWAVYLIITVAFLAVGSIPCYKTINYVKTVVRSNKH